MREITPHVELLSEETPLEERYCADKFVEGLGQNLDFGLKKSAQSMKMRACHQGDDF
jgi:hypothetical protein